jgi:hypothetical protein
MTVCPCERHAWLIWTAKDGWCWWYRNYAPGDTVLERLGQEVREAKKGLWVDPQLVPPWEEWRKRNR